MEEAQRLYLARNPELQSARDQIDAAEGRSLQAGLRPNPLFQFSEEGFSFGADDVGFFNNQEFIVSATQRFELGGKRGHRKAVAQTGVDIARAELEEFIRLGKARVRETFLRTVFAQKKVAFTRDQLQSYARIREIHRQRFEAGDVSGLSQMRVDLEEMRFLSALSEARTDFTSAWSELAALIGWSQPEAADLYWERSERSIAQSLDQLKEIAVQSRPDLAALSLIETQTAQRSELEKAHGVPDVTLGGGYKRDFGVNSFYASVSLPLPLFDRNQGSIQQAAAELRSARNRLLWKTLLIRAEVESSYRNFLEQEAAFSRIDKNFLQTADTLLTITRTAYEAGESSLTDYLDALRVRLDASLAFYDLLFRFERSRIQLEQAVGVEIK